MPQTFTRAAHRWLLAFNQRPFKRGSFLWFVRGVERSLLRIICTGIDAIVFISSRKASVKAVKQIEQWPEHKRLDLITQLQAPTLTDSGCTISLICASRKMNNPNQRLPKLLQSIIDTASDLSRIEIIIRIDEDDDLLYYSNIRTLYGAKIRMRVMVGKRVGYLALHHMNTEMAQYAAAGSQLIFSVADDCILLREGWDEDFVRTVAKHPDNIIFINTWRDYIIAYEDPYLFFWLLWQGGPPTLYWAVGKRVLDITNEIAKAHADWTACGNNWMCDNFFEALQFHLWRITQERRAAVFPETITARMDTLIPEHKQGGLFSHSPAAIDNYKIFLTDKTQAIIKTMAEAIAREIKK